MSENVVRFSDYERKSRDADAVSPRDPSDAVIIILPTVPIERHAGRLPSVFLPDNDFPFPFGSYS
jgi:hypothetical protein